MRYTEGEREVEVLTVSDAPVIVDGSHNGGISRRIGRDQVTDGAILIFATAIIAVPEARERVPIAHYVLAANALLLMVRLSVWTRLWRRHVRSLNQQQIEVDFWRMTTSLNLHLTWPIIVLCVVLAALAFAVLDDPFQAVMVVWTRVMNVATM